MSPGGKLSRFPWRRALLALGLVVGFGIGRIPLERALEAELRAAGFRDWSPNVSNREQLTQAGFVGALGGFRSLIASVYDLKAHNSRSEYAWAEVEQHRNVATTLQPRFWKHWDQAAWDMAWNAHSHFRRQAELHKDEYEGWRIENVVMPRYLEKGIDFAQRGIRWLPESYRLPLAVAQIYGEPYRYNDPCSAVEWYLKAAQVPSAPAYIYRAYAHHLVLCGGREEQAYRVTAELYRGAGRLTPTVRHDMELLEDDFARRAAQESGVRELQEAANAPGASYRDLAALAMRLLETEADPAAAAGVYRRIIDDPEAPKFYRRKLAASLAQLPDRARAAHRALRSLFEADPDALRPEDFGMIRELEDRLNLPPEERIIDTE